jgi:DNA-directed RNA polymerase specialized sigma24 family protein
MVPPAYYEPYLDGLFTYCLSILCEHDAAAAALGDVLALAERQRARLRDPLLRRPWLYALARWACLRRLAGGPPAPAAAAEGVADQRRAQLAALAWPEAAGTTPEQREALELAVRHQLPAQEVAHVLGMEPEAARGLLGRAACEVERTRTALAVVDTGHCAAVAQLAGEARVLLGTALRGEIVRHVDDCGVCRRTAERVVAEGPWPGAAESSGAVAGATGVLALIEAPRSAACAALLHAMEAGTGRSKEATPRFDRRGFPMDLRDRAARRAQLRHRAVTTTVVAAVVAAPVLALWAAYRAAPLGDDDHGGGRASASEPDGPYAYENAGSSRRDRSGAAPRPTTTGSATLPSGSASPPTSATPSATAVAVDGGSSASGLTVSVRSVPGATLVTLTAGEAGPVRWTATADAPWLRLSSSRGTLGPGQSVTISVTVSSEEAPPGSWTARISFSPGGAAVVLRGSSTRSVPPPTSSSPTGEPPTSSPPPTSPPPTSSSPTPPPSSSPPPSSTPPTSSPSASPPPSTPAP